MDLHSGLPYFLIRNGLPYLYPALSADHRCDVLVIGGGITGALCAHACTSAGARVAVIDQRAIATGSTAASTALLQYEIDTPLHELSGIVGMEAAVDSYRLCAEAVQQLIRLATSLGVQVRARESLQYASRRSHVERLRAEYELRTRHGFAVDFLEAATVKTLFGFSKPAALLCRPAAEIDPYAFTHALFQDIIARKGHVFERTAMKGFTREGNAFVIQTPDGFIIRAEHLVMATGYESQALLPEPVMTLNSTYAVASERMERDTFWHQDCFIWETDRPYLYLRTTPDGRIIIGGLDEPFRDPARRDRLLERKAEQLAVHFGKLFPDLPFRVEYAWCGTFGSTQDGLPYIDRDEHTGAWFVLGMGGNGITFSQVGANIVRDAVMGQPSTAAELFGFQRSSIR